MLTLHFINILPSLKNNNNKIHKQKTKKKQINKQSTEHKTKHT